MQYGPAHIPVVRIFIFLYFFKRPVYIPYVTRLRGLDFKPFGYCFTRAPNDNNIIRVDDRDEDAAI